MGAPPKWAMDRAIDLCRGSSGMSDEECAEYIARSLAKARDEGRVKQS